MFRTIHNHLKPKPLSFEEKEREKNITYFSLFTISVFLLFGTLYLVEKNYFVGTVETLFAFALIINLYYLRQTKRVIASARILVLLVMVMSLLIFTEGGVGDTGNLWILAFPMFALLLLHTKEGVTWVILYSLLLGLIITLHFVGWLTLKYEFLEIRQTLIVFAVFVFLTYFNEKIKIEARKELDAANRQLIDKDRLLMDHSKVLETSKMMKDFSYQFQQPLNNIGLMLQNLPDDFEEKEINRPYLDKLVNDSMSQIRNMSHALDDFRLLFHSSRNKEYFTVAKIVQSTLDLLELSLKGYYINFTFRNEAPTELYSYENDLMRAVFNLVNNAKDIIVTKRQEKGSGKIGNILVHAKEDADHIYIEVKDDAGNIPEALLGRIFDPYYTSQFQNDTRLVGLYITKVIIEKNLEGNLMVSNCGNGVCFTITLPKKMLIQTL